MRKEESYNIQIWVGAKEHYDGATYNKEYVENILQTYCDNVSFCVTLTETTYIYKNGKVDGFVIGIINYPRFPSSKEVLFSHAYAIAVILKDKLKQFRISITTPQETFLLEDL